METSALAQANIVAFLDSNSRYHGKLLHGVSISPPATFNDRRAVILISSQTAEREIKEQITQELRWPNRVICLYEGSVNSSPSLHEAN